MSGTFIRLRRAIVRKIYKEREQLLSYMDKFLVYKRITEEEYDQLLDILNEYYPVEK